MSLITCGLADILIYSGTMIFDAEPIEITFSSVAISEEFLVSNVTAEFDTAVQVIEFDIDIIKI